MLIQAYQNRWVKDFEDIKKILQDALKHLTIAIEHVGSTAVPNLAAKPIIDIDIVYNEKTNFNTIKKRLEKIGYLHNGNQGIKDREVFKRYHTGNTHGVVDTILHHLYVCPDYSEELQRHLVFRNYLRIHEQERAEYENLKYKIAEQAGQDRKIYAQLKEIQAKPFVEDILQKSSISGLSL